MSTPEDVVMIEAAAAALAPESAARAPAPPTAAADRCDNCGASVPGRYCGNCGQRLEPPLPTLGHFLKVAFEDITHADSRLWRTLGALLFKPGFLTREFLDGKRARYLPPVRLYLVISVAFFVWLATFAKPPPDAARMTPEQRAAVAQARQAAEQARQVTGASSVPAGPAPKESFQGNSLEGDTEHCNKMGYKGPWRDALVNGCKQAARDQGRSLIESFMHNLPRAMFVFLPLLAAVMMLLYWHPRHYYVEHLLFYVHNHAFVFLVILIAGLLGTLMPSVATAVGWLTTLYIAWYVYRATRVMYRQGRLRTFGKLAVLGIVYLLAASVMLGITGFYALMSSGSA